MPDIYKGMNPNTLPTYKDYPDNPGTFGTSLKLLVDAKQLAICHMGFRFDSYMGNCSSFCSYCYARGQNMRYNRWGLDDLKIADLDVVKNEFHKSLEGTNVFKKGNMLSEFIKHRYPIRMGTQTDCFQEAEKKYKISYRFINEIMNKYDYPYVVCTKHKLVADDEYMELYKGRDNCAFQFTLSTINQDFLNKIERGAASAKDRLATMKKLSDAGHHVVCRISPYIPEYMNDLPELVNLLADNGCKHVISELLRVTPILNKVLINECGFDAMAKYKAKGAKMSNSYVRYPLADKIKIQKELAEMCKAKGMTFATCADEDPSFHTQDNCCGLDCMKKFSGCPQTTYDTAWKIAKANGSVSFDELIDGRWCPDVKTLRKTWESGYYEHILLNFKYDKDTKRYTFVEANDILAKANSLKV